MSFAKTVLLIAAIAVAVMKHGVVKWSSLHGTITLYVSGQICTAIMSLSRHFF